MSTAVTIEGVSKRYVSRTDRRRRTVHALSDVDLVVAAGTTTAIVGESGCGKSTLARIIVGLEAPNAGSVRIGDAEVTSLRRRQLRTMRQRVQIVFQDPYSSLDPRMTVAQIVAEPLRIWRRTDDLEAQVARLLRSVRLDPDLGRRRPHELSGGQRQRIAIARAVALDPQVLVCDEPTSALDTSVQAQVLDLLVDLRARLGLTMVVISHDLAVVGQLADRVAVMYLGRVVEEGAVADVYRSPAHPYTAALLAAAPVPDPTIERRRTKVPVVGEPPDPADPPEGCHFRPRCWKAGEECFTAPELRSRATASVVACHRPLPPEAAVGDPASSTVST